MTPAIPMTVRPAEARIPAPWFLLPVVVTAFLCLWTSYEVTLESAVIAFALLCIPAASYLHWQSTQAPLAIPLFAGVGGMYWLYFCFAYFLGGRKLMGVWGMIRLDERYLSLALAMAGLGVAAMACGYAVAMPLVLRRIPVLREGLRTGRYLRGVLLCGAILASAESSTYWLGAGGRQIMTLLKSFVPLIAFACLLREYLAGRASRADRNVLLLYGGISVVSTVASGWLGPLFGLFIVATSVYLMVHRRLPLPALTLAAAAFLFFQAGKDAFRSNYWYRGEAASGKLERVVFWMNESSEQWRNALTAPDSEPMQRIIAGSLGRVSLLEQTANVLQLTPSPVPFQNGATYAYMLVSLVPRSLTESYVNFGWTGVAGVMFLLGLFLRLFERVFLSFSSGPFLVAVGLALTPSLLVVEAQAAQYIGGLIQYIVIAIAAFLPVLELRHAEEPR